MRFKLTVRDGRVFTGEIVGEAGPAILFRDDPGSGLLSIPLTELTGAYILDDSPLEIDSPIVERTVPYYEINESEGDLIVSVDNVAFDSIRANIRGNDLVLHCTGSDGSNKFSIPLPVKPSGRPVVFIGERIAEIVVPLS